MEVRYSWLAIEPNPLPETYHAQLNHPAAILPSFTTFAIAQSDSATSGGANAMDANASTIGETDTTGSTHECSCTVKSSAVNFRFRVGSDLSREAAGFSSRQPAMLVRTIVFGQKQSVASTYRRVKTMRSPSRLIPPRSEKDFSWLWLLGALLAGFGYFVYSCSNMARCITAFLMLALGVQVTVINRREKRRFERMCSVRDEESICTFARSFSTKHVDTWIIRAAHQEIQQLMKSYIPAFPVRASDSLLDDLHIDSEDMENLLVDIAARSGHSLDGTENNPFYGKVDAVRDLVLFINAQPRLDSDRPSA